MTDSPLTPEALATWTDEAIVAHCWRAKSISATAFVVEKIGAKPLA